MTKQVRELLTNILNSLDRLFDGENQAIDVYYLLLASSVALAETEYFPQIQSTTEKSKAVMRSRGNPNVKRDAILDETQSLREYLSDVLYRDSPLTI